MDGDRLVYNKAPADRGKCFHCGTVVEFVDPDGPTSDRVDASSLAKSVFLFAKECPSCGELTVSLAQAHVFPGGDVLPGESFIVWPRGHTRPIPKDVPAHIAQDYSEASAVLSISPKASAALSRRCLQTVLREAGKTTSKDLSKQIDEVLPKLPSYLADNVDAIRNIGNFAAHPQKSIASDQILDVEPAEAEWNLDVLDDLFDFYYVQPAAAKAKRDALNQKLAAAGKPEMKTLAISVQSPSVN